MKKIISLMLVTIMMILSLTSCDLLDRFFDEKTENEKGTVAFRSMCQKLPPAHRR